MTCETTTNLTCDSMLIEACNAYNALVTGAQEVEINYRDSKVKYTAANVASLKEHISNLHATCGSPLSSAILGIGRRRGAAGVRFGNNC